MSLDGVKANVAQFQVGNTQQVRKQQDNASKPSAGGEVARGEKGDELLAFLGLQGKQNFDISKAEKKERTFDLAALTAQVGELDQSTTEGLQTIAKNLPMFASFSGQLEASGHSPESVFNHQQAFLKELS